MLYRYCNDCGQEFSSLSTYRNCKSCMAKVKKGTLFNHCQRCNGPKKNDIWGLCKKCAEEVGRLNQEARIKERTV